MHSPEGIACIHDKSIIIRAWLIDILRENRNRNLRAASFTELMILTSSGAVQDFSICISVLIARHIIVALTTFPTCFEGMTPFGTRLEIYYLRPCPPYVQVPKLSIFKTFPILGFRVRVPDFTASTIRISSHALRLTVTHGCVFLAMGIVPPNSVLVGRM